VPHYPGVERVTRVDLDAEMTRLFSTSPDLIELNHGAFADLRVTVVNEEAVWWGYRAAERVLGG
jgi:spermidine synthase